MGPIGTILFKINSWFLGLYGYKVVPKKPKAPLRPIEKIQPSRKRPFNTYHIQELEPIKRGVEGLLRFREIKLFIEDEQKDDELIEEIKYKYALEMFERAYNSIKLKVGYRDITIKANPIKIEKH